MHLVDTPCTPLRPCISPPGRRGHCNAISTYVGRIQPRCNYCANSIRSHVARYSFISRYCFNHFTTASYPKLCVMKVEITKKTVPSPSLVNITQKKRKITITNTVAVELVSELDTLTALEEVRRGLVGDA